MSETDGAMRFDVYELCGGPKDGEYIAMRSPSSHRYRFPAQDRAIICGGEIAVSAPMFHVHEYSVSRPGGTVCISQEISTHTPGLKTYDLAVAIARTDRVAGLMTYRGRF
jgi:hypothetical protein